MYRFTVMSQATVAATSWCHGMSATTMMCVPYLTNPSFKCHQLGSFQSHIVIHNLDSLVNPSILSCWKGDDGALWCMKRFVRSCVRAMHVLENLWSAVWPILWQQVSHVDAVPRVYYFYFLWLDEYQGVTSWMLNWVQVVVLEGIPTCHPLSNLVCVCNYLYLGNV
jgi:hypothetical protein